jgi:hypothetical protein
VTDRSPRLVLSINAEPDTDNEELAELTRRLREDLMELSDIEAIDLVHAGEIPERAKASASVDWGTLLVALAASGGVLTMLINVLQSWLTRHERHSVTLEIDGDKLEVKGISSGEQQRLIDAWISRRTGIVIANG